MLQRFPFKRHLTLLALCFLLIGVIVPTATFAKSHSGEPHQPLIPSQVTPQTDPSTGLTTTDVTTDAPGIPPSPTSTPQKLVVLVQGINTHLKNKQVAANIDDTFYGGPGLPLAVFLRLIALNNAQFLEYSYAGSDGNGNPTPYTCADTFTHPLDADVMHLGQQIFAALTHNPKLKGKPTDVYIISHSMGGTVALGYVAALYELSSVSVPTLPTGDHLKAVVTLDSPVGGITDNPSYFDLAAVAFQLCGVNVHTLPGGLSLRNLVSLFQTTSNPTSPPPDDGIPDSQGSHASILEGILGGKALTNQGMAERAAGLHGTNILTIGNTLDFLWNPSLCAGRLISFPNIDFHDTQWLEDDTGHFNVYSREISAGATPGIFSCSIAGLKINGANHSEVLHNTNVDLGLLQFLPAGAEPTVLSITPVP